VEGTPSILLEDGLEAQVHTVALQFLVVGAHDVAFSFSSNVPHKAVAQEVAEVIHGSADTDRLPVHRINRRSPICCCTTNQRGRSEEQIVQPVVSVDQAKARQVACQPGADAIGEHGEHGCIVMGKMGLVALDEARGELADEHAEEVDAVGVIQASHAFEFEQGLVVPAGSVQTSRVARRNLGFVDRAAGDLISLFGRRKIVKKQGERHIVFAEQGEVAVGCCHFHGARNVLIEANLFGIATVSSSGSTRLVQGGKLADERGRRIRLAVVAQVKAAALGHLAGANGFCGHRSDVNVVTVRLQNWRKPFRGCFFRGLNQLSHRANPTFCAAGARTSIDRSHGEALRVQEQQRQRGK